MTAIPTTAKAFERWLVDVRADMPHSLYEKAHHALLTLKSMDQVAFAQSKVLQTESAKDLSAFAEAYGAWQATKGMAGGE